MINFAVSERSSFSLERELETAYIFQYTFADAASLIKRASLVPRPSMQFFFCRSSGEKSIDFFHSCEKKKKLHEGLGLRLKGSLSL